jgi:hypothetical protein
VRYRLRTLLILLALLPPLLWFGWTQYAAWKAEQERRASLRRLPAVRISLSVDEDAAWQSRLGEYSEPPATPMQPNQVDMRKLTRPAE